MDNAHFPFLCAGVLSVGNCHLVSIVSEMFVLLVREDCVALSVFLCVGTFFFLPHVARSGEGSEKQQAFC